MEGKQSSDFASSDSAGPETKSSWPPIPEYWVPLIVSAMTCPWMSIAIAPLIVTISRLRAITSGELTISTGRKATSWLPSSHSYSRSVPAAKVATETPSNWPLLLAILPASCSCISPVVNISEWTP